MSATENIRQHFENILDTLKKTEQSAQVLNQLQELSRDITRLEKQVLDSLENLESHFQAYSQQMNLLSKLREFQRKAIHFQTPAEMTDMVFKYLREYVNFDRAFFHLQIEQEGAKNTLITPEPPHRRAIYEKFLKNKQTLEKLSKWLAEKELGILLPDVHVGSGKSFPWELLEVRSAILFPLRAQGTFLGIGMLLRKETAFAREHLSFINLILGMLSLLLFQHFHFYSLKQQFFKRFKLQKVLEGLKYAESFDNGPLFIYSLDLDGSILHANTAGIESLHRRRQEVIGSSFVEFLPPEHRVPFHSLLDELIVGELKVYRGPLRIDEQTECVWEYFLTRMELYERFYMNIVFAVDITEQYFREKIWQRNRVLDQVAQFSRILNGHLNDLLTVMVPNISLMKTKLSADHELQKYLRPLEKTLNQTNLMVRKFLNYDLPEIEQPKEINLNELITLIVKRLQEKFNKQVGFKFFLDPQIPPIHSYSRRLTQLIKIFSQNSLEALEDQGFIRISTKIITMAQSGLLAPQMFYLPKGRYIELAFEDDGSGIAADMLPHIFDPFFTTKVKNEGVGLGLFVAYNIVKDFKGEIYATSTPGESTVFYTYIPLSAEEKTPGKIPPKYEQQNGDKPYILIIDDEYHIRDMLKEVFESRGYTIYTAADGNEGLEVFEKFSTRIDLVILDMAMPLMDGRSVFSEIMNRKNDQKIMVMSGYYDRRELEKMLAGARAFLSKPFHLREIMKQVDEILQS